MTGAKQDIILRLRRRSDSGRTAKLVSSCVSGDCSGCGDVCPLKSARWRRRNLPAVEELFSKRLKVVGWEVLITSEQCARQPDELSLSSIGALEKGLRRSFDRVRLPSTIAVGMMDAWYGWRQWEVGARLLVVGPSKSELFAAFPVGVALQIEPIRDVRKAAEALFTAAQRAKYLPPFDAVSSELGSRRRGEYYAWLGGCPAGSRLFRYGCDRYFNPLNNKRPLRLKPKKRHPYPYWLRESMFGNHAWNCQCIPCQGLGNP
jgi:hypothetical protein